MKNYYEILEVDKNASSEIINKAYKLLAKKYHPDLQETEEAKKIAEEQIKLINDAYDTLSDKIKREDYNKTLQNSFVSPEEYDAILGENLKLKQELNILKQQYTQSNNNYYEPSRNSGNYNNSQSNNTSHNNYYNYNYNSNSQESETPKLTLSDYIKFYTKYFAIKLLKLIGCLAIICLMFFILFKIPYFKQLFTSKNIILIIIIISGFFWFYGKNR